MAKDYVWVDRQYKRYTLKQIDSRYLKNILRFLCRGGGYLDYLDEEKITKLFTEATRREIAHPYKLEDAIRAYRDRCMLDELSHMDFIFDGEF